MPENPSKENPSKDFPLKDFQAKAKKNFLKYRLFPIRIMLTQKSNNYFIISDRKSDVSLA